MIRNAISVDVEEYFHANNLVNVAPPKQWNSLASRAEKSTYHVLDLFDKTNVKGTFFVLGYVAHRYPKLVREIVGRGHELASHGYAHRLAFNQTPQAFSRDVRTAKSVLEDISGVEIHGYRAPSFSITSRNLWAYDTLIEAGYTYDSSLYPTWHPRYGNRSKRLLPFVLQRDAGQLIIYPLAVTALTIVSKVLHFPAAGGAYWRLLPRLYIDWALDRINSTEQRPFICYFHPWELDPQQHRFEELSRLTQLRHYGGIERFETRVERWLNKFNFGPIRELIETKSLEVTNTV